MKKIILVGFFCFFNILANATVQVQVDSSQVSLDDAFHLVITEDNFQNGSIPDLTPLQKEFMILGTEQRMNYSVINGQTQSSSEWIITLKAQKEGKLTIPPIKIGKEFTTPISLNVSTSSIPQNTSTPNQQKSIYLTTEVNNKNPFVNQQIIYKVRLYNSKHLLNADYQGPIVENALLIPLGEGKRYQTQKNNVDYLVEEQDYAIYPQKSGPLKIKSPTFTALVYDFNPEHVKAQDKTINLNIRPIPKEYLGKPWLPAKKIELIDKYENTKTLMTQGNTLVRTVILKGVGVPAQLLPDLNFKEIDGVNVYPEKGKEKNKLLEGELIGHSEIKVTYLFNKSGRVILPELKLSWFNTETGKEEIATLPAKIIKVSPSASLSAATTVSKNQPVLTEKHHVNPPKVNVGVPSTLFQFNWAWLIAAFFALAWLVTLALWGWQKRTKNTKKSLYKEALNELHQACNQSNPQRARDALLKWARLHWPNATVLNLTDLTHLITDVSFQEQVQILSQVLYKNKQKMLWRGDELWLELQQVIKNTKRKKESPSILPPINPS